MLPTTQLPYGYGAILYYSIPPFHNWEIIGAVHSSKQSGIFRTGWTTKEEMVGCPIVQLGVSIERYARHF